MIIADPLTFGEIVVPLDEVVAVEVGTFHATILDYGTSWVTVTYRKPSGSFDKTGGPVSSLDEAIEFHRAMAAQVSVNRLARLKAREDVS